MVAGDNRPVVLVGFMGSGKSTLGQELAVKVNRVFTDLDKVIESSAGMTIPEIFEKAGESHFRKLESEALEQVLADPEQVIAIGGGAPCNGHNICLIKEKSISIYLKISVEELFNRLTSSDIPRPLLVGKNNHEIRLFIAELLQSREFFYNQADMILESDRISVEMLLEMIVNRES